MFQPGEMQVKSYGSSKACIASKQFQLVCAWAHLHTCKSSHSKPAMDDLKQKKQTSLWLKNRHRGRQISW